MPVLSVMLLGVYFLMLLEILRTLERLLANLTDEGKYGGIRRRNEKRTSHE